MTAHNNSLGKYKTLLVALITSLTVTGSSYIDNKIWNVVIFAIGAIAYSVVGFLFSIGVLHGKKAGKEAYIAVFIFLLLLGCGVYCVIEQIQKWVLSWSLTIKIIVPIALALLIVGVIIIMISASKKDNSNSPQ